MNDEVKCAAPAPPKDEIVKLAKDVFNAITDKFDLQTQNEFVKQLYDMIRCDREARIDELSKQLDYTKTALSNL